MNYVYISFWLTKHIDIVSQPTCRRLGNQGNGGSSERLDETTEFLERTDEYVVTLRRVDLTRGERRRLL